MSGVVIIGGGPAGAATAIALARAGQRPLLFERCAAATEKVCGEFLAEDAAAALAVLGLDLPRLGAVPIERVILGAGRWQAEFPLPFPAWSLPRAVLDAALLDAAHDAGAALHAGRAVLGAEADSQGWRLRLAGGDVVHSPSLVLATGKHELRGLRRAARGGSLGVKLLLRLRAPEGAVVLLACRGGYAGFQPRPDGLANLCAALHPAAPGVAAAARSAETFLNHVRGGSRLAERLLADAEPVTPRPMTVAGVPYGFVHHGGGPLRVGDQAAVIPSFCGDGVAMALWSGLRAAESLHGGVPAAAHHAAWSRSVQGGMCLSGLFATGLRHAPAALAAMLSAAPALGGWAARRTRLGMVGSVGGASGVMGLTLPRPAAIRLPRRPVPFV